MIQPECPFLLHHFNNASRSLTTSHLIQEMSCPSPSPRNICCFFLHFLKILNLRLFFLKSMDSRKFEFELILQEKSVRNACRQMQTVWDSNLSATPMSWLTRKFTCSTSFWQNLFFTKKAYGLGQNISCITMTSRHYSNDAKEADILERCGLPLNES